MSLLLVQQSDVFEIAGEFKRDIPFVIMTSDDTHSRTLELLKTNNYFGMNPKQVHLLKQVSLTVDVFKVILIYKNGILRVFTLQEKVACLDDNDARLAVDPQNAFTIQVSLTFLNCSYQFSQVCLY